jgi:hypothetical protein
MGAHGELTGEGKEGQGGRGEGAARGRLGEGATVGGDARSSWLLEAVVLYMRNRKTEGGRRKRDENFPNLYIFGEKNRRQF